MKSEMMTLISGIFTESTKYWRSSAVI